MRLLRDRTDGSSSKSKDRYASTGKREIFIEYVLLKDLNDGLEHADLLAAYLEGLPVKVNLIPYNAQRRTRFFPPELEQQKAFFQRLREKKYQVHLRHHKGRGIMAACGQLGNKELRHTQKSHALV